MTDEELNLVANNGDDSVRILDRRLQALRKAKKIEYRGGWHIFKVEI